MCLCDKALTSQTTDLKLDPPIPGRGLGRAKNRDNRKRRGEKEDKQGEGSYFC